MDDRDVGGEDGLAPRPGGGASSPEQQELEQARDLLARLHEQVVALEMKHQDLQSRMHAFAHEKLLRLGPRYARVDALRLSIAEALLDRNQKDPVLQRRVQEARSRAEQSEEDSRTAAEIGPPERVVVPPQVKELFRKGARRMHPDLGRTQVERDRRHAFMVRLNAAYAAGDVERLQDVIDAWDAVSSPPPDVEVAEELARVQRAIARHRLTLRRLEGKIAILRDRPDYMLMVRVHEAAAKGQDLLADIEARLDARIEDLEQRLRELGEDEGA